MTREEAIAYLEDPFPLSNSLSIERRLELHDKALSMAIEALKAESYASERYADLCEYFDGCSDKGAAILHDRNEFKAWLERGRWHVKECDRLARELDALKAQIDKDTNVPSIDTDRIYAELSKAYNVKGLPDEAIGIIGDLMLSLDEPSAQLDNQVNLCDSCKYAYPDCPSGKNDVIFGNGIGNDNICACAKYVPSAQQERTEYIPDTKAIPSEKDCVDLSERVTATFYDEEHEEWSQKTVTIRDILNSVCDEYTVLPSVQPAIMPDGTLTVTVDTDIANIGRILLSQTGTQYGGLYYKDAQPEPSQVARDIATIIENEQDMRVILQNERKTGKWIPCSERLPENSSTVLITHKGGVSFGWYNGRYWERGASTNHRSMQTVTAWMPLPDPYKKESGGK